MRLHALFEVSRCASFEKFGTVIRWSVAAMKNYKRKIIRLSRKAALLCEKYFLGKAALLAALQNKRCLQRDLSIAID
jgi:hypothetical protein